MRPPNVSPNALAATHAAHASRLGIVTGKSLMTIPLMPLFADATTVLNSGCPSRQCQVINVASVLFSLDVAFITTFWR